MSNIDKQALREAAEKCASQELLSLVVYHGKMCLRNSGGIVFSVLRDSCFPEYSAENENYARLTELTSPAAVLELLDEITELRDLLKWAHDTLIEINPNNYTHDDVCEINNASVEVILGIAPVLGETHGKSEEWWAARAAGTAKGE